MVRAAVLEALSHSGNPIRRRANGRIPAVGAFPVNVRGVIRRAVGGRRISMARDPIHRAGSFEAESSGGAPTGLFADEDDFDRRTLVRLASWGAVAVSAVAVALYTNQSSIGWSHEQVAAADLARQEQQIRSVAKEGQNATRRLASAIDTLNGDRDRLYSRVTVLEQGLDSVTGAITRQKAAVAAAPSPPVAAPAPPPTPAAVATSTPAAPPDPALPPVAPVTPAKATTEKPAEKPVADASPPRPKPTAPMSAEPAAAEVPVVPSTASKSLPAPADASAGKPTTPELDAMAAATPTPARTVVAAVPASGKPDMQKPDAAPSTPPKVEVQKTEFAVDVGGANSLGGLRALWRGLLKSRSNAPLAALHPIIMIKENSTGPGMQLRLGAGPLSDAAAAARICAVMVENHRPCETTVYDGQRLEMPAEDASANAAKPGSARPPWHRRSYAKRTTVEEPPPAPPPPEPTTLSTIFGRR